MTELSKPTDAEPGREVSLKDTQELHAESIAPEQLARETAHRLRRRLPAVVLSLLIGGGFIWLLYRGALPVLPAREAQAQMAWWTVPAYALLFCVVLFLRAGRWCWLVAPIYRLPLREVLAVNFVFFAAVFLLPLRMGEAVRPVLLRRQGRLSAWQAFGCVAAERVIDGLVSSLLLFVALTVSQTLEPLPERIGELPIPVAVVPRAAYTMLAVFGVAFVTIAVFYRWRKFARALTERVVGLVSSRLGVWLSDKIDGIADGLRFLPQARFAVPFLGTTLVYWILNVISLWVLMVGSGLGGASLAQAATVLGVLALVLLVPAAPGFFGSFQVSIYAGLAMYFVAEQVVGAGSVVVFWMYTIQTVLTLLGGLIALGPALRAQRAFHASVAGPSVAGPSVAGPSVAGAGSSAPVDR